MRDRITSLSDGCGGGEAADGAGGGGGGRSARANVTLGEFIKEMEQPGGILHKANKTNKVFRKQKKSEAERVKRRKNDEELAERATEWLK